MSMTKEVIRKFVEEDYKDFTILVTTDNEHRFYHRSYSNSDIVWDWDNDRFIAMECATDLIDQNKLPVEITSVSLDEIQFLTAYIDTPKAIEFINKYYTDEESKKKAMSVLKTIKPGQMGPRTLRRLGRSKDGVNE